MTVKLYRPTSSLVADLQLGKGWRDLRRARPEVSKNEIERDEPAFKAGRLGPTPAVDGAMVSSSTVSVLLVSMFPPQECPARLWDLILMIKINPPPPGRI